MPRARGTPYRISLRLARISHRVGKVAGIGWPPHRISLRLRLGFCDSPSRGATAGLV